ncbi:MAG: DUF87 domain-containing protein, partial [Sulfolobales archaeon]
MEHETYEFRDGLLVYREGPEVCLKRVIKVASVSTAIQDLDDYASIKYIKAYINAFNLGFPLEFHTFIKPVDRLAFVKNLERIIAENTIAYEVNPFKADSRLKAERAKYIRTKVLKDSLQPFETEVYIAVTACDVDFESSLEVLKARIKVLRSALNTLGIDIEEIDAERAFSRMLLAGLPKKKRGLLHRVVDKLRKRTIAADLISIPVFTFIPLLGRTRPSLRSYGIKLGIDLDSGEEVYWNLDEVTSPHVLVVGPSGIGKTTFLAGLALSLNKAGLGVLVIDPKNEYKKIFESRGKKVAHFTLGRNISIGLVELLKAVRSNLDRDLVEVLLDIMSFHRELNKRDVFSCLHTALSNLTTIPERGDLELVNSLKRFSRYCSEEYSEYVINKVLSVLAAVSGGDRGLFSLFKELDGLNVLDVSPILSIDPSLMPILLKVISVAMKTMSTSYPMRSDYRRVVVIDEAWTVLKEYS